MRKSITLITLIFYFFISLNAQESIKYQNKVYRVWVRLNNQNIQQRAVLYEINDSSILISNSLFKKDYLTGNFRVSYIDYRNIDRLYLRNKNSVVIGTIIGTAAGIAGAYGIASGIARKGEVGGAMIIVGSPLIILGTTIGVLAGQIRIRIPINGSYEDFKINESRLKGFSFVREFSNGLNPYEQEYQHKWFLGFLVGPSFPYGDFKSKLGGPANAGMSKTGGSGGLNIGRSFKNDFGISASIINSQYSTKNSNDDWWDLINLLIGPMYSVSVIDRISLDLKPMIGYSGASRIAADNSEKTGNGFTFYPCTSIRYNFSRRWCAQAEAGYFLSNQKFLDYKIKIQAVSLSFGLGYRFK